MISNLYYTETGQAYHVQILGTGEHWVQIQRGLPFVLVRAVKRR